jgi:hypothetical protein
LLNEVEEIIERALPDGPSCDEGSRAACEAAAGACSEDAQ